MSNGRPSRDPMRRSSGGAALRGGVILVVALVIGVVLLGSVEPSSTSATGPAAAAKPQPAEGGDVVDTTVAGAGAAATTTTEARHAANLVRVLVVNGSGVNGVGARVRAQLLPGGWDLQEPRTGSADNLASFVYFRTGFASDAAYLATQVGLAATKVMAVPLELPVATPPEVPGFDVMVVVGPDLAPRYAPASTPAAPARSTAAPATTRKVASATPAAASATPASVTTKVSTSASASSPAAPAATSPTPATAATAATKVQARATNTAVVQN